MSSSASYVSKLNDRDVIRAFLSVAEKFASSVAKLTFNDLFDEVVDDSLKKLSALHGHQLTSITLRAAGCHWQWMRIRADQNDQHSPYFDKLTFSWSTPPVGPHRETVAEISAALNTALARPLASVKGHSPKAGELPSHDKLLLAMESTAAAVLTDTVQHRQSLDDAYIQRDRELSERIEEERNREIKRLADEKSRQDEELLERRKVLDERETELVRLQKKLDDRNNTHVRRDIRANLLDLAKERLANFAVSRQTRQQYLAVHAVSVAGILLLGGGSASYAAQIIVDTSGSYSPTLMILSVKSGALAAVAIALGTWYLRWLNRWLQRIADAEFKLQQFRLDIERASWLAETVLEWKSTAKEPFPELLAARLSTGLFSNSVTDIDDPKTPASHLAEALLGAAASAKLKVGEQEISLDRRSLKELGK